MGSEGQVQKTSDAKDSVGNWTSGHLHSILETIYLYCLYSNILSEAELKGKYFGEGNLKAAQSAIYDLGICDYFKVNLQ